MAWEWSHTNEAYSNAYNNLMEMDDHWLADCFSEWICEDINDAREALYEASSLLEPPPPTDAFLDGTYEQIKHACLKRMERFGSEYIADAIWERAEQMRTCDNGGFNAWMCSCGCHTVPFDREEE